MKKIIRLTESDLRRIVRRVINEQKDAQFDDLIGKSVTFKIKVPPNKAKPDRYDLAAGEGPRSGTGMVKGIIEEITIIAEYNLMNIKLKNVVQNHNYVSKTDDWHHTPGDGRWAGITYYCQSNIFAIELRSDTGEDPEALVTDFQLTMPATCKGLAKVLSKRYPCSTDFAMSTPTTLPDEFTDLT